MNYVEKLFDEVHYAFNLNAATLSGAIDILVIPQLDGTLKCTPFHVRFGKLQLIQSSAKVITIYVNGVKTDLQMKLGQAGEAFFVEESDEPVPALLATSPIPSPKSNRRSTTTTTSSTTSSSSSSSSTTTTTPLTPTVVSKNMFSTTTTTTSSSSSSSSSTTSSPTAPSSLSPSITTHMTTHSSTTSTITNASPIPSTTTKFTQKSNNDTFDPKEMTPLTSALEEMILNQTNNNNSFYNYTQPTNNNNNNNSNNSNANNKVNTPSTLSRGSSRPSSPVTIDSQSPLGSFIIDCGNDIINTQLDNSFSPNGSPPKVTPLSVNNTTTTSTAAATVSTTVSTTEPSSDTESEPKFWRWGGFPKFTMRRKQQPTTPAVPTIVSSPTLTTTTTTAATISTTSSPTNTTSLATSQDNITDQSTVTTTTTTTFIAATTSSSILSDSSSDIPIVIDSNIGEDIDTDSNIKIKNRVEEITDDQDTNTNGEPVSPLISSTETDDVIGLPIINNNNNSNHSIPIPTPNNTPINPSVLTEHHQSSLEGSSSWTRMGSLLKMFKKEPSGGNNLDTLSNNDHININSSNKQTQQSHPSFIVKDTITNHHDDTDNKDDNMFLLDEEQEEHIQLEQEKQEQTKENNNNVQKEETLEQHEQSTPKTLSKSLSYADIVKEGENILIGSGLTDVLAISPQLQSPTPSIQLPHPPLPPLNAVTGTTIISTSNYSQDSSISECLSKINYESEFPALKTGENHHHHNNNNDSNGNNSPLPSHKVSTTEKGNNGLIDHFSISLSLCGHLILDKALQYENEEKEQFFKEYLISFEHFCSDPLLLKNPHLVAKINEQYYPWSVAGHIILSYLIYRRPITQEALNNLKKKDIEDRLTNADTIADTPIPKPTTTTTQSTQPPTLQQQPPAAKQSYWKSWLWKNNNQTVQNNNQISPSSSPPSSSQAIQNKSEPIPFDNNNNNSNTNSNIIIEDVPKKYTKKSLRPTSDQLKSLGLKKGNNRITFVVSSTLLGQKEVSASIYYWDNSSKIVISDIDGTITKSDVFGQVLPLIGKDWSHIGVAELYSNIKENGYQIIYLTSRAIGQANLTRTYISSVKQTGSTQNTLMSSGSINGGIGVVSSSNSNTNINNNNSSTGLNTSGGISNNNNVVISNNNNNNVFSNSTQIPFTLPEGPVFMSPNRLLTSFNREVIKRNPEEFKIACLQDIQNIFPSTCSPFYAGFGNRNTDAISYNAVGVPKGKTFTINALGVINTTNTTYNKTYTKLNDLVQDMFPCQNSNKHSVDEQWNEYHYWKKSVLPLHKLEPL